MAARRALATAARVLGALVLTACSSTARRAPAPAGTASTTAATATSSTAARTSTTKPMACSRPHASGQSSETFDFEGVSRAYQLYVPPSYRGPKPVPVVFNFHGYGSNA